VQNLDYASHALIFIILYFFQKVGKYSVAHMEESNARQLEEAEAKMAVPLKKAEEEAEVEVM